MEMNGAAQDFEDVSFLPIYSEGTIKVQLKIAKESSFQFQVSKCEDDFDSGGEGYLRLWVGGIRKYSPHKLQCICKLQ